MEKISRFELARLLSARALQLSLGAPPLVKPSKQETMLELAKKELGEKVLPLTVVRVLPSGDSMEINV